MSSRGVTAAVLVACCLAFGAPAAAARTEVTSFGVELGAVNPEKASTAFTVGARLGLGTLFAEWLDFSTGISYWSADREPEPGDISDLRLTGDLKWRLVRASGVRPYLLGGLTGHIVRADLPSFPRVEETLEGFYVGANLGFGVESTQGALGLGAEFRREFVNNVDNWNLLASIRWRRAERVAASR